MRTAATLLSALFVLGTAEAHAATTLESSSIRVAAAADLKFALDEIVTAYRARARAAEVKVSYGSSGSFLAQISNGAPIDLFLSADVRYPRRLVEAGLAVAGSEFPYAIGRLVVWVPNGSKLDVTALGMQALLDPSVKRVAIANPAHAPYGRAAEAAMRSLGIYDAVKEKLVFGENIAQAAHFVRTGNADVGVLALSLAVAPTMQREGRFWEVPLDAFSRMDQGGAIVAASKNQQAAKSLADFLTGPEGRAILKRYGFFLPPGK